MAGRGEIPLPLAAAMISLGLIAACSWVFMLLLGMFAGHMAMPGLAIGYWASLGIFMMLRLAFGVRINNS